MTGAVDPRTLPPRPPSEVEWEDLLVRVEIAPRALRVAVEDAPADSAHVVRSLQAALRAERRLQDELMAIIDEREAGASSSGEAIPDDAEALVAEYARLRFRSFVMVQRRGLSVWDWTVRGGDSDGATAYQLFQSAAHRDGALLAAVRAAVRERTGA